MPAKIRTIKAALGFNEGFFFEFNKSINYKGETFGAINLREKKPGVLKVNLFQDLNGDGDFTKSDLIFKGKIKNVEDTDDLTNFIGSIKLKKQMHSCEWDMQKEEKKRDKDMVACTRDYVPTMYGFMMESASTGKKYFFDGIDDFKPEVDYIVGAQLSSSWYPPADWSRWTI